MIESEEELIDDPEVNFLNSLTKKQKKKLLKWVIAFISFLVIK